MDETRIEPLTATHDRTTFDCGKYEDAKAFYLKYGFIPLQDDAFHLYLPMATVRAMFVQASPPDAPG